MKSRPTPTPTDGKLLRLRDIIGSTKTSPPTPAIIPVSRSTWLAGVKSGRFPKPIKIGPRVTVWKSQDVYALIASIKGDVK